MRVADASPGTKAGEWTICSPVRRVDGRALVDVECSCGHRQSARVDTLPPASGHASSRCRSCASRHTSTAIRDLRSTHPLYETWRAMVTRCHRPYRAGPNWRYYGARGIEVCERWREGEDAFWRFVTDVGERPDGHTLDRIDVDGDYEPGNVRWATPAEQRANQREMPDGPF